MKNVRLIVTILFFALLFSSTARPQTFADDPRVVSALDVLKVWLEARRDYDQIPGVSAAVVYDQHVLWIGGFGYADLARKIPAGPDTIYSICSISKLFTSISVMQLRDAGKLRLDDPVGKHLSWFNIQRTEPEGPEITIEGLLTHASGLPREAEYPYWTGPNFNFPTREEVMKKLSSQQTLYPAETYFQYSNLGLTLAGEIVAAVSDQPYAEYVRRNILEPLGLSSTSPEMPDEQRGGRLATGYGALDREGKRAVLPFFLVRGIAPAAGFASTARDLARFASWQFRLLGKGGTEVLKANTLREMYRVHWVDPDFETTWGLGFSVSREDGKTFVGHGGLCPGYQTMLLLKPDEKIATVFMANALGVNTHKFAVQMYDLVAPAVKEAIKNPTGAKEPDPELKKYLGIYSDLPGEETAVVLWEGGLAMLSLSTTDPVKNLIEFRKTGENIFRRIRKDETLGEEIVFEIGADGRPVRIKWNSNYLLRLR